MKLIIRVSMIINVIIIETQITVYSQMGLYQSRYLGSHLSYKF